MVNLRCLDYYQIFVRIGMKAADLKAEETIPGIGKHE